MTMPQRQKIRQIYRMLCSGIEEQFVAAQQQAKTIGHIIDWPGLDLLVEMMGYDPNDRLGGYIQLQKREIELSGEWHAYDSYPRRETLNKFTQLPEVLVQLPELNRLKLSSLEHIKNLPEFLAAIPNLKALDIINCHKFCALPKKSLEKLEALKIIGMHQFSDVARHLAPLTSLRYLTLSRYDFNRVAQIPQLQKLKRLELHYLRLLDYHVLNRVQQIFFQEELIIKIWKPALMLVLLGAKGKVKKIEVRGGFGAMLLEKINALKELEELTIYKSESTTLPASIGQLKNLKRLNIWCCKAKALPETLGNLANLKHLHLSFNRIRYLPNSLSKMRSLTHLNAGDNYLSTLPACIGEMRNLQFLRLSHNIITSLPDSLGEVDTLKELYIDNNRLSRYTVPRSLVRLEEKGTRVIGLNRLDYGWDTLMRVSALAKMLFA